MKHYYLLFVILFFKTILYSLDNDKLFITTTTFYPDPSESVTYTYDTRIISTENLKTYLDLFPSNFNFRLKEPRIGLTLDKDFYSYGSKKGCQEFCVNDLTTSYHQI
jgi:hypothetical protein